MVIVMDQISKKFIPRRAFDVVEGKAVIPISEIVITNDIVEGCDLHPPEVTINVMGKCRDGTMICLSQKTLRSQDILTITGLTAELRVP